MRLATKCSKHLNASSTYCLERKENRYWKCYGTSREIIRGHKFGLPSYTLDMSGRGSKLNSTELNEAPTTQASSQKILTLPTWLTLGRVVCIPALVAVWFGSENSALWTTGIFLTASITDFLDGYLARKMGTHSSFGAFLDPVADKLMVCTVLILLSSRPIPSGSFAGNAWLLPTIASTIIGREIAMSALREWAAAKSEEAHKKAAVSSLGKWKTTTQMISVTLLLYSSGGSQTFYLADLAATAGMPLLFIATFLTVYSLYQYIVGLWKYIF